MKMTIREIINKLNDIERAVKYVNTHIMSEKTPYTDEDPKEEVIDLLEEYAETIKNTKVDI